MTELQETFVKPDAALEGANHLGAAGARLATAWSNLSGTITALNGGKPSPWGDDEPGNAFNKDYLGGEDQPAQRVLEMGAELIPVVELLGPTVKGAVEGTVDVDDMVKTLFGGDGR
ncbi:hypothetical protein KIF24_31930 [Micromonospora sp. Llam7]|uniref:hypothetical protein n=1 Tax=Micromonospora tarapacensis TaxID=2835305 RepID=UPI001C82D66B|nr:hypothetical protein [Micromonospora tarapacensis]MBX7270181.1 hypothetical protein [Micromonospora tarapacensis]